MVATFQSPFAAQTSCGTITVAPQDDGANGGNDTGDGTNGGNGGGIPIPGGVGAATAGGVALVVVLGLLFLLSQ